VHEFNNSRKVSNALAKNIVEQKKEFQGNDTKGKYNIMKRKLDINKV